MNGRLQGGPYRRDKRIKQNQSEMKNALTDHGNRIDAKNSRLKEAEEQISDPEDKVMEHNDNEQKRKRNYGT